MGTKISVPRPAVRALEQLGKQHLLRPQCSAVARGLEKSLSLVHGEQMEGGAPSHYLAQFSDGISAMAKAHLVRFEDLTTDPATTLREAAAHLGLDWDPGMLEAGRTGYRAPRNLMARRLHEVTQPIQQRADRWRRILSDADANSVIAATASIARQLGYDALPPTGGAVQGCETGP